MPGGDGQLLQNLQLPPSDREEDGGQRKEGIKGEGYRKIRENIRQ